MAIRLDLKQSAPVQAELRRQFKEAADTALVELADYLQRESPRGVSSPGDSLAGNWDVKPSRKVRGFIPEVMGTVTNNAVAAEFRIRGRGPGRFPPFKEGSPLAKWAAATGAIPFLVAKSIAEKGTQRWREGAQGNILKQDPKTLQYAPNSPLYTIYERALQREWGRIRL